MINKLLCFIGIALLSVSCTTFKNHQKLKRESEAFGFPQTLAPKLTDTVVHENENIQTQLVRTYNLQQRALPYPHPQFFPVTSPYQKIRNDSQGKGFFGASRGRRTHNGLDILVSPGNAVYCPIEGVMLRMAYPYGTSRGNKQWEGCAIVGVGDYQGYEVKIFYMRPFYIGDHLFPGDIIGIAQDISRKYSPAMMDHLHVEVRRDGVLIDPATLFELIE